MRTGPASPKTFSLQKDSTWRWFHHTPKLFELQGVGGSQEKDGASATTA